MRLLMVVLVAGALVVGGCGTEQKRLADEDDAGDFSATQLGAPSPSLLRYLTPEERGALEKSQMDASLPHDPDLARIDEEEEKAAKGGDKEDTFGAAAMSVLSVGVTLGMMAAPYLLF